MERITDFTNLYQRQITLRFGLQPMFETQEFLERAQIIENDERRAKEYKVVKKVLDAYHRDFIKCALTDFARNFYSSNALCKEVRDSWMSTLNNLWECYLSDNSDNRSVMLENFRTALRKLIVNSFKNEPRFGRINKKELIQEDLPLFLKDDEQMKSIVSHFSNFTMYFIGYNQNRMNMYTDEAKSTAIGFRLINQNLMKFIDNLITLTSKILPNLDEGIISQLNKDFEPDLNTKSVLDMFQLDYYHEMLTQEQIAVYNAIIGGRVDDGEKVEIKGLNQYINEYAGDIKLPKLQPLYNLILSERVAVSFRDEQFDNANQVVEEIIKDYQKLQGNVLGNLKGILDHMDEYDLNGVFVDYDELATISQRHYGAYHSIKDALIAEYVQNNPQKSGQISQKLEKEIKKFLDNVESLSLGKIDLLSKVQTGKSIVEYFKNKGAVHNEYIEREDLFSLIENRYNSIAAVLSISNPNDEILRKNTESIKDFLDAVKALQQFVKPLCGSGNEIQKDELFYGDFSILYSELDDIITPLYNKVRNYLSRKPYSDEKFKLNFESPSLLRGWPDIQEYSCALFRKDDNNFYLAILDNKSRQCLNDIVDPINPDDQIHMMKYLQGGKMGQNVQNLMAIDGVVRKVNGLKEKSGPFAGQNLRLEQAKNDYLPEDINRIRRSKSYSTLSPDFSRKDLNRFISFYMPLVKEYYSDYDFEFKQPQDYATFSDFTDHINGQAYQLKLVPYSWAKLKSLVAAGQIYLFRLTSKDFSSFSKGRPNLHTIYWRMLFSQQNLKDVIYKLNGEAEVFFRRKSIDDPVIHRSSEAIRNKSEYNKLHKPESTFAYDIIKDRRYTLDHFEFHVPITLNFKAPDAPKVRLNHKVLQFIKNNGIKHIIGIDRGERHLLYLSIINLKGEIVKQVSLNKIASNPNSPGFEQDFNVLLANREGDRLQARRNWTLMDSIKDLKTGYLSQVVHLISRMMVEYDAIVVLENLNKGFIRKRGGKVEKSVYQKFEKMLIDKLGYMVDKTAGPTEPCGALKALQLSDTYESFNRTEKMTVRQCGFLFYIPAWNTSKIDPVTGFVNLFDTRLTSQQEIIDFFSNFDRIIYNPQTNAFEFSFDYSKFTTKANGTRTQWTISSFGDRIHTHRDASSTNQFVSEILSPTNMFKDSLQQMRIDITSNIIEGIKKTKNPKYLPELLKAFKLVLQMRNSQTNTEIDYLLSPAIDEKGIVFDSRKSDRTMPDNADANGAYNIARKGLMIVNQIKECSDIERIKFDLSNKKWLQFAQKMNV